MGIAHIFTLLVLTATLSGCGGVQKIAVGTTAGLLYDAAYEMETEPSWEHLKDGMGPNLKVVEGLHHLSPSDEDLLVALTKGYGAYAFAIHETEALADQLAGKSVSLATERAQHFYSRSIEYGLLYFKEEGIELSDLMKATREEGGVPALLSKKLPSNQRAFEGAAFFAQSLGGLINLKKDDMVLVAQLPIAKGVFDWVCSEKPDINHGACDIFYGAYEAGRPRMLGGNPEKGKAIFLSAIEKNPHNWLARIAYLQYYILPLSEEDDWAAQKKFFQDAEKVNAENMVWRPGRETNAAFKDERLRAFQAIALKRWSIIKKFEKDLF